MLLKLMKLAGTLILSFLIWILVFNYPEALRRNLEAVGGHFTTYIEQRYSNTQDRVEKERLLKKVQEMVTAEPEEQNRWLVRYLKDQQNVKIWIGVVAVVLFGVIFLQALTQSNFGPDGSPRKELIVDVVLFAMVFGITYTELPARVFGYDEPGLRRRAAEGTVKAIENEALRVFFRDGDLQQSIAAFDPDRLHTRLRIQFEIERFEFEYRLAFWRVIAGVWLATSALLLFFTWIIHR